MTTPQELIYAARDEDGRVEIAEYHVTLSALRQLEQQYQGVVYDVSTGEGMKAAKDARKRLRKLRTDLEAKRKELKAPILDYTRALDGDAKAITARIEGIEKPIDEQIKAEEARAAREKAEREEAERKRISAIRERIEAIRATPGQHLQSSPDVIEEAMDTLMADPLQGFEELDREAALVRDEAVAKLHDQLILAQEREAERAELEALRREKAEREEAERKARERQVYATPSVPPRGRMATHPMPDPGPEPAGLGVKQPPASPESVSSSTVSGRSPVLDGFLSKHGGQDDEPAIQMHSPSAGEPGYREAVSDERWFDVEMEWSGYCRGTATYRVKAATAAEAMERWADGERVDHTIVRDDTEKEAISAHLAEGETQC